MEYQEAQLKLNLLFDRDPANVELYAAVMEFCEEEQSELDAVEFVESSKTRLQQIQTGESLVAVLVRRGGLDRILRVDGEEYHGTLEELQNDEEIDDEAVIESFVVATQAGLEMAESFHMAYSIPSLFAQLPQFVPGFKEVLTQCAAGEKTTKELQEALISAGIIRPGFQDSQEIHASYFTSKLERYGALVWDRKRWCITPKGEQAL